MANDDFLIIADGPTVGADRLRALAERRVVIALDGAADKLRRFEMIPNYILGDLDSIEDRTYWGIPEVFDSENLEGRHGVQIVWLDDQRRTDMEKGILFCDSLGATSIVVVDGAGGRMDHALGNIRFLRKYYKKDRPLEMVSEIQRLRYLQNEEATIHGTVGDPCGIFGFPYSVVTTRGLAYDVELYELNFAETDSIANAFAEREATINVQGDALIIW